MARQFYYAESTGQSTTAATSYQDKTTLTFTPDDSSTYVIIATWMAMADTNGQQIKTRVTRTSGTPVVFNEFFHVPESDPTTEYYSYMGLGIDTFGVGPGSQTYKIQYETTNGAYNTQIKNATIIAIKLSADDQYNESTTLSTTTSTTFQDKNTLTFTPATTGDYLVLAAGQGYSTFDQIKFRVLNGATGYNPDIIFPHQSSSFRYALGFMRKLNLANSSQTLKTQFSENGGGGTSGIENARIVALRLDGFDNNYYAEDFTNTTATSSTYVNKITNTASPSGKAMVMGRMRGHDSTSNSGENWTASLTEGTTDITTEVRHQNFGNNRIPFVAMYENTYSGSSIDFKLRFKATTTDTINEEDAAHIVLMLDQSVSVSASDSSTVTESTTMGISGYNPVVNDSSAVTESITMQMYPVDLLPFESSTVTESTTVRLNANINTWDGSSLFRDSYDGDLSAYNTVGTWSITNGVLTNTGNTGGAWANAELETKTQTWTDFEAVGDIRKGTNNVQMTFRSNTTQGSGYGLQLRADVAGRSFRLEDWGNSNIAEVDSGITWTTGNWYSIRVRCVGNHIQARVWSRGSAEPTTWNIDTTNSLYSQGGVGFGTENTTDAQFDNLNVYSLVTESSQAVEVDNINVNDSSAATDVLTSISAPLVNPIVEQFPWIYGRLKLIP